MNYSGLSAHNQSHVRLHFPTLEKAVPCVEEQVLDDISYDTFTYLPHDKAIAKVNTLAQKGLFVPLPMASMVISKFCDARRGDVVDAVTFLDLTVKKYSVDAEACTQPAVQRLFCECIWVYAKHQYKDDVKLKQMLKQCYCSETYTALTSYYNRTERPEETMKMHENWPPNFDKIGASYRYLGCAMKALKMNVKEVQVVYRNARRDNPKLMDDASFVVDYIKMGIRSCKMPNTESELAEAKLGLEEVDALFKEFPLFETEDKIAREKFSAFFAAREFERAAIHYMPCLDAKWVTAKTFEVIIMGMAQTNLSSAVELYARKFDQNYESTNRKFELNFHKGHVSSHGSQEYGAEKNLLVQVKLWHLFCKIKSLTANSPRDTVNICIITGKGKAFRLKNYVLKYLKDHFSWDMKKYNLSTTDDGYIRISTMVKFLMSANNPVPKKIQEDFS